MPWVWGPQRKIISLLETRASRITKIWNHIITNLVFGQGNPNGSLGDCVLGKPIPCPPAAAFLGVPHHSRPHFKLTLLSEAMLHSLWVNGSNTINFQIIILTVAMLALNEKLYLEYGLILLKLNWLLLFPRSGDPSVVKQGSGWSWGVMLNLGPWLSWLIWGSG